tara:strand:- start:1485 stop:2402 length:918 start_codon:yes stop_codon:yes gene_type:complete
MKFLVIGLGNQGIKRIRTLKKYTYYTVDPFVKNADFKNINQISKNLLNEIEAAIICTPEKNKFELIKFCFNHNIHVLVEKPLLLNKIADYNYIERVGLKKNLICYTAYNHRFEPHIIKCKQIIKSGRLGKIYHCRMFYGNGTARIVKNSPWKDKQLGVISDLGSHLIDTLIFLLGFKLSNIKLISSNKYENNSTDHAILMFDKKNEIHTELEMTLCMWKNTFTCDIIGEKGSIHIDCLCKWGPSTLKYRKRTLPSGVPKEKTKTIVSKDPTWQKEIKFFISQIKNESQISLDNDKYIFKCLKKVI